MFIKKLKILKENQYGFLNKQYTASALMDVFEEITNNTYKLNTVGIKK